MAWSGVVGEVVLCLAIVLTSSARRVAERVAEKDPKIWAVDPRQWRRACGEGGPCVGAGTTAVLCE